MKPSTRWCLPRRSLAVAAAALAVAATPGAPSLLAWDRGAILAGEVWRLWTGHLVHASGYHLTWNLLPLVALGLLWESVLGRGWWSLLGWSALVVSGGLFVLDPELAGYVGLSGVLNGIWVGGAMLAARRERESGDPRVAGLFVGFVVAGLAKISFEAMSGIEIFTDEAAIGAHAVPLAHTLGALAGATWALTPGGVDQVLPRMSFRACLAAARMSPLVQSSSIRSVRTGTKT